MTRERILSIIFFFVSLFLLSVQSFTTPTYIRNLEEKEEVDTSSTVITPDGNNDHAYNSNNPNNVNLSQILKQLQQVSNQLQTLEELQADMVAIKSILQLDNHHNYFHTTSKSIKNGAKGKGGGSSSKSSKYTKKSKKSKKSKSEKDDCVCPTLPPIPPITNIPTISPTISPTKPPTGIVVKPTVRIMPFGDSLTKGQNWFVGGYRGPLYEILTKRGYYIDFVGTKNNNSKGLPDKDHEGTGGMTIRFFNDNAKLFLDQIDIPDVILLHVGTNDFGKEDDITNAIRRFGDLLRTLGALRPNANIIATSLIVRNDAVYDEIQRLFNAFVEDEINEVAADGIKVTYLDMHAVVTNDQLVDGIHPNEDGYRAMASAWADAIQKVVSPQGDNSNPQIIRGNALGNRDQLVIEFSKPISSASVRNLNNFGVNKGVQVLGARLDATGRKIILSTTDLSVLNGQSVTVVITGGVKDRTDSKLPLPTFSSVKIPIFISPPTLPPGVKPASTVRIMPLGSTLTKGVAEFPGSYRKRVYQVLSAQGWNVDFVGTKVTNRFPGMDPHHEGTTDKFITFFTRFAEFWLDKIDYPDIILLHAGIFDFVRNIDISNTVNRYEELLAILGKLRPYSHIIATNLISKEGTTMHENIQQHFNPFIEETVRQSANKGILVSYLDIASYIQDNQVDENSLLNQAGYDAMGNGWVDGIKAIFTPLGDPNSKPVVLSVVVTSTNTMDVTYTKPVADSAANLSNYKLSNAFVRITSAKLNDKKRIVTLTTTSLNAVKGQMISLDLSFVTDRIVPPNTLSRTNVAVSVPLEAIDVIQYT